MERTLYLSDTSNAMTSEFVLNSRTLRYALKLYVCMEKNPPYARPALTLIHVHAAAPAREPRSRRRRLISHGAARISVRCLDRGSASEAYSSIILPWPADRENSLVCRTRPARLTYRC
jgi:hypothetical protein